MQFNNSPTGAGRESEVKLRPAKPTAWRIIYHEDKSITVEDHGVVTTYATRAEYDKAHDLASSFVAN